MKLSVFLPSIRVHLLRRLSESIIVSLGDWLDSNQFELVVSGPFDLPHDLYFWDNRPFDILHITTHQSPTCAAQEAALNCAGDYILHTVDDCVYLPGQLKKIMEAVEGFEGRNIWNAKYLECATTFKKYMNNEPIDMSVGPPNSYWYVNNNYPGLNIPAHWGITCHFIMPHEAFLEYGGFDCNYEYLNHGCHDLLFRMYQDGWDFQDFTYCSLADWVEGVKGDHKPINDAQLQHDGQYFYQKWAKPVESRIDPQNYLEQPKVWERRFSAKVPQKSYEELGYAN